MKKSELKGITENVGHLDIPEKRQALINAYRSYINNIFKHRHQRGLNKTIIDVRNAKRFLELTTKN